MERYRLLQFSEAAATLDSHLRSGHVIAGADGNNPYQHLPAASWAGFEAYDDEEGSELCCPEFDFGEAPDLTLYHAVACATTQDTPPFLAPLQISDGLQGLSDDIDAIHTMLSDRPQDALEDIEAGATLSAVNPTQPQATAYQSQGQSSFVTTNYSHLDDGLSAGFSETYYAPQGHGVPATNPVDQNLSLAWYDHTGVQDYPSNNLPPVPAHSFQADQSYYINETPSADGAWDDPLSIDIADLHLAYDTYNGGIAGPAPTPPVANADSGGVYWGGYPSQGQRYQSTDQPSLVGANVSPGGPLGAEGTLPTEDMPHASNFPGVLQPNLPGPAEDTTKWFVATTPFALEDYGFRRDSSTCVDPKQLQQSNLTLSYDTVETTASSDPNAGGFAYNQPLDQSFPVPAIPEGQENQYPAVCAVEVPYAARDAEEKPPLVLSTIETPHDFSEWRTSYGLPTPDSDTFPGPQVGPNFTEGQSLSPAVVAPLTSRRLPNYISQAQTLYENPATINTGLVTPPSSAGTHYPSPNEVDVVSAADIPVLEAAPKGRRRDRQTKTQSEQSFQDDVTCAESNSATSQGWASPEAQPAPHKRFMTLTPEDILRYHRAHKGLSEDRVEPTKNIPKAPKGKKKAPGKVKSRASKAASVSTSKPPPKPRGIVKSSDPVDCPICGLHYNRRADYERHVQTGDRDEDHIKHSQSKEFKDTCTRKKTRAGKARCSLCNKTYSRGDSLRRHLRTVHKVDPDTVESFETVEMDVDEEEEFEYEYEDMDMD